VRSRNRQVVRRQLGFATFCRENRSYGKGRTGFYELSWSWRGALFQVDALDAPPTMAVYFGRGPRRACNLHTLLRINHCASELDRHPLGQGCASCTPFPGSFTVPAELDRPGREGIAF
jgi:hypothetical protein